MSKLIANIEPDTDVIVGNYYNVPCAVVDFDGKTVNVPVIGIAHNDKQLGFDHEHLHIDGRFNNSYSPELINWDGRTNAIVALNRPMNGIVFKKMTVAKRKCVRKAKP